MSLDETLDTAGLYARFFSSNSKIWLAVRLEQETQEYIVRGYEAGASGIFGQGASP
jgi:hypothetical protein